MVKKKAKNTEPKLQFYQKLVLNRFMLSQFGVDSLQQLSYNMKNPKYEQIDNEGVTGFYKFLKNEFGDSLKIDNIKLAQYDLNIVSHVRKLNDNRKDKIVLKYFQYLSLLFVEYYLDAYFNNLDGLLMQLNNFVEIFNEGREDIDKINLYGKSDLNKIALWNATGSGKTILMHINYYQFLYYSGANKKENLEGSFILLTPKEGLSLQHLSEFNDSGIKSRLYDKKLSNYYTDKNEINIIENTKLDKKDGDKKVSVYRFGDNNVVFVDEGHRGASGDTWYVYRNMLCENGFSFEYSATFGQAIAASNNQELSQEYCKCILFDYSYKYFYSDGYGKDYNIMNLQDDSDDYKRKLYLTACLITYYQQKKLFLENKQGFKNFNLENPLFIFVGGSVNAVRTENKKQVSDVVDILLFFRDFTTNSEEAKALINRIISGSHGLLDINNRDIFYNSFVYLTSINISAADIYSDILSIIFNCNTIGASMHIENLKGVQGEIRVRLGENEPFGLINVGDDASLLKLCDKNELHTGDVEFGTSLFQKITEENSTINILIGSKKFTEGWNCWRVSTMGLMNIGRTEGSEIIQLFGRGVRLKGYEFSLKRSNFFVKDRPEVNLPKFINILETLNVFGVRADYMRQFNDYLKAEGVPIDKDQPTIIKLPVIKNKEYKKKNLYQLKILDGLDYKKDAPKPSLKYDSNLGVITLDCYSKIQFETSKIKTTDEVVKNEASFKDLNLRFLNYDNIYFELQRYKNEKARFNLNISKNDIIELIQNNDWYKLLIPAEELELRSFDDYKRWEKICISLLQKYCDRLYYAYKNKWEKPLLEYTLLDDTNENFIENDEYIISISKPDQNEEVILFIENIKNQVLTARQNSIIPDFKESKVNIEISTIASHLYNPLVYLGKNSVEISVSPVALNESEIKFIHDLKNHVNRNSAYFADKEMYLIRNKSKKGIGFFESEGFYPDFIMWVIANQKQYITFVDPHGMRNMSIFDDKVKLRAKIKDIELSMKNENIVLNSVILTPTKQSDMIENYISKDKWEEWHVLFMDDEKYVDKLFNVITDVEETPDKVLAKLAESEVAGAIGI